MFKGDIDRNSAFYDLIRTPYTPRTIGLKLELFKSIQSKNFEIDRFQNHLNESIIMPGGNSGRNTKKQPFNSCINAHINIFYLRDKVLEHRILHERFEALAILSK